MDLDKRSCWVCKSEMKAVKTSVDAGWGDCKFTIGNVDAHECTNCGEKVFSAKDVKMLQELGKKFESENK